MPRLCVNEPPRPIEPIRRLVEPIGATGYRVTEIKGATKILETSFGDREIWTSDHRGLKSYAILINGVEHEFVQVLPKVAKANRRSRAVA